MTLSLFTILLLFCQWNFITVNTTPIPIVIDLPDPLLLPNFEYNFNSSYVKGSTSVCSGVVTGLSTLIANIDVTPAPGVGQPMRQKLTYNLSLESVHSDGLYTATLEYLNQNRNISGAGAFSTSLKNANCIIELFILPLTAQNSRVALSNFNISIDFESASANFENAVANGVLIDWDDFNFRIKTIFEETWAQIRDPLTEVIGGVLNNIFKSCTIADFIGIIGGGSTECLNLPEGPVEALQFMGIKRSDRIKCEDPTTIPPQLTTVTTRLTTTTELPDSTTPYPECPTQPPRDCNCNCNCNCSPWSIKNFK